MKSDITASRSRSASERPGAVLYYDGACPFCSAYVRLLRLSKATGRFRLVNAREDVDAARLLAGSGLDLDEGMVLEIGGSFHHGDDCIHRVALLSGPNGAFNHFNAWVFGSRRRSQFLYPVLRAGRNLTLRLLARKKLHLTSVQPNR